MPNLKVLTWNLLNIGPSDLCRAFGATGIPHARPFGDALMSYIALAIVTSGADIVCLQEIIFSTAQIIPQAILIYLERWNQEKGLGVAWNGCGVAACVIGNAASNEAYDGYAYFWNTNTVNMQMGNGRFVSGVYPNLPGNPGQGLGRGAAYMLANPVGSAHSYMIMNYHAPSEGNAPNQALGLMTTIWNNAQNAAGWNTFDPPLTAVPAGIIIAGDFNVNSLSNVGANAYNALQPALQANVNFATSLTSINSGPLFHTLAPNAAQATAVSTAAFVANAYDHFLYANVTTPAEPVMVDCIAYNAAATANNEFQYLALEFINPAIWQSQTLTLQMMNNFNANYYPSFVLYRYAISDHMPVLGYFTLA